MRYFGLLSYDGTAYHGWQRQPNAISVQEILENRLSVKLRKQIQITGAGRTDTGVHASYFVVHFDFSEGDLCEDYRVQELNHFLPEDVRFHEFRRVKDDAHARFDALSRTYQYVISTKPNPFLSHYAWSVQTPLDVEAMNVAASYLISINDFTSFAKLHSQAKTNICEVSEAFFQPFAHGIIFKITANRFLRNMVRSIVGTLLEVGRLKLSIDEFKAIVAARNRNVAGVSAPAKGLFLTNITYPNTIFLDKPLQKPRPIFI